MDKTEEELFDMAVSQPLEAKVKRAIALLQHYQQKALALSDKGYYLAFSGGKDSVVIKQLAIEAGVKFEGVYTNTTIDPPEVYQFLREYHKDIRWEFLNAKRGKGFFEEMIIHGTPTPRLRWCCKLFKEGGGKGLFKVVGVRATESARRKRLWKEVSSKLQSEYLAPILYWTDDDVWKFIKDRNLPYCSLYDQGFSRVGCVGCPLAGSKNIQMQFKRYPRYERAWKNSIYKFAEIRQRRIDEGTFRGDATRPRYNGEQEWIDYFNQVRQMKGEKKCVFQEMIEQAGGVTKQEDDTIQNEIVDDDIEV